MAVRDNYNPGCVDFYTILVIIFMFSSDFKRN